MKRCENKAEWPQNLVFAIFGRDTLEDCRLSPDWRGSLEYVLISLIPDDEELALRCRYQEGLTYQEIGERLGADKEVARRKIDKGIRRLRHPYRAKYMYLGVAEQEKRNWEWFAQRQFNEGYWVGFNHGHLGDMAPSLKDPYHEHTDLSKIPVHTAPIEWLELKVRTLNCLRLANIKTVGDLLTKSRRDLLRIRNFGKVSVDDVEEKLARRCMQLVN